jgi:hypothetical protein
MRTPRAIEDFKKVSPCARKRSGEKRASIPAHRVWFADEARIGQKNKITRRWAKRGTRLGAAKDQRTASAYIFGATCPRDGKGAALVMPRCDTEAMNHHLAEIAAQIAPGAHAAVLVDQAGWHLSGRLTAPINITVVQGGQRRGPTAALRDILNVMSRQRRKEPQTATTLTGFGFRSASMAVVARAAAACSAEDMSISSWRTRSMSGGSPAKARFTKASSLRS